MFGAICRMLRAGVTTILILCSCFITIHVNACARNKFQIRQLIGEKHVSALILARGGSKEIPLKNISKIGNITLIANALKQIKDVGFSSTWVSTDSTKIFNAVLSDAENIHWRSEESATDNASSVSAINEFLKFHPEIDAVALIQCTSPFQKQLYIKRALNFLLAGKDCVFSVTRTFKLRWVSENEKIVPLNFSPSFRPRRQDWNGELIENGMFYLAKKSLLHRGLLQNDKAADLAMRFLSRETKMRLYFWQHDISKSQHNNACKLIKMPKVVLKKQRQSIRKCYVELKSAFSDSNPDNSESIIQHKLCNIFDLHINTIRKILSERDDKEYPSIGAPKKTGLKTLF